MISIDVRGHIQAENVAFEGIAEHPDRCRIGKQDPAVRQGSKSAVRRVLDNRAEIRLGSAQCRLHLNPFGNIPHDGSGAGEASGLISYRRNCERNVHRFAILFDAHGLLIHDPGAFTNPGQNV